MSQPNVPAVTNNTDKIEGDLMPKNYSDEQKRLAKANDKYGEHILPLPTLYDRDLLVMQLKNIFVIERQVIFEIGDRLNLIFEHETKEEYIEALKQINISARTAKRYRNVSEKMNGERSKLVYLGDSKAIELLYLHDDQLDKLVEEEEINGITLDEMDRMSVRELHDRLRENEKNLADKDANLKAKEEILAEKNKKIDEQAQEINKLSSHTANWNNKAKVFNQELSDIFVDIFSATERLEKMELIFREMEAMSGLSDNPDSVTIKALDLMENEYVQTVEKVFNHVMLLTQDTDQIFNSQIIEAYVLSQQEQQQNIQEQSEA